MNEIPARARRRVCAASCHRRPPELRGRASDYVANTAFRRCRCLDESKAQSKDSRGVHQPRYRSIAAADLRPATIAVTTRCGPVTTSPPLKTPFRCVAPVRSSANNNPPELV